MADEGASVAVPCPRCGAPFVVAVRRLRVGYETDIEDAACECDLDEDEYEELLDRAVAAVEGRTG